MSENDELEKAIGALPLPWGEDFLEPPLQRIRKAIDALCGSPVTFPAPTEVDRMGGWAFSSAFLSKVAYKAREHGEDVTMEDVEAVLKAVLDVSGKP